MAPKKGEKVEAGELWAGPDLSEVPYVPPGERNRWWSTLGESLVRVFLASLVREQVWCPTCLKRMRGVDGRAYLATRRMLNQQARVEGERRQQVAAQEATREREEEEAQRAAEVGGRAPSASG